MSNSSINQEDGTESPRISVTAGKRGLLRTIFLCVLAVIIVRSFIVEPFKIPSSSMLPTLRIGDHIFVSKFNYGLFFPYTKMRLLSLGAPKRGEVIVFLFPRDESLHYIKRVVGIPGDKIEIRGRDVLVNGEVLSKEKIDNPEELQKVFGKNPSSGEVYQEKIGDYTHYVRYSQTAPYDFSRLNPVTEVPEGQYFVMGDNRDDSYDSRSWGTVPVENIRGRAQVIWLSLEQEKGWPLAGKPRWDRFFKSIH